MSGSTLPYQLRPNKAVERVLFIELLRKLQNRLAFQNYTYISFGGPQLEDFRLIHAAFPEMSLVSIEQSESVLGRQKFNKPNTLIKLKKETSKVFIEKFSGSKNVVFWLDYTSPDWLEQLAEIQALLRKLKSLSILKITFNANPTGICVSNKDLPPTEARFSTLKEQFGRLIPANATFANVQHQQFPSLLLSILELACAEGISGKPSWIFKPLQSFVYADGQQMLTLTGIIGPRAEIDNILDVDKITTWHFFRSSWKDPIKIDVPDLTLKERIEIERWLPALQTDIKGIQKRLRFHVGENEEKSLDKLRQFVSFYRHYPFFCKIAY